MTFLELAHMRDATQPMVWGGWGMMTFLELAQRLSEPRVVPISHKGCPNQVPPLNPTPKPKGLSPSPTPKPQVPMSQPSKPKGLLGSALSQFCGSALIQIRGRLWAKFKVGFEPLPVVPVELLCFYAISALFGTLAQAFRCSCTTYLSQSYWHDRGAQRGSKERPASDQTRERSGSCPNNSTKIESCVALSLLFYWFSQQGCLWSLYDFGSGLGLTPGPEDQRLNEEQHLKDVAFVERLKESRRRTPITLRLTQREGLPVLVFHLDSLGKVATFLPLFCFLVWASCTFRQACFGGS